MEETVAAFLTQLKVEKGQSNLTARTYQRHISHFLKFIRKVGRRSWSQVKAEDFQAWIMEEKEKGFHANTLYIALASLRAFFKYLHGEGSSPDFSQVLDLPRRWESLPHALTQSEIEQLLKASDLTSKIGIRDRAILELFYSSGLRLAEMAKLKLEDIQWDLGVLRVLGKGNKQRIVPVGRQALGWLQRILKKSGPNTSKKKLEANFFLVKEVKASAARLWLLQYDV